MQAAGIESGIVNASGDMTVWGLQPDGRPWTIGIIDSNLSGDIFSNMQVNGLAIATSGNFEKYVIIAGKKYSDTINPRTGLPITGIKSVTIIGTNAEITDAMATPVMIMGVGPGMYMIDHMKDIEAIIVDDNDRVYKSANIYFSHEKN
jgi:thiamine biosynthesis lipoprotein